MFSITNSRLIVVAVLLLFVFSTANAASYYNIGTINTTSIYVSPSGNPSNSGLDRSHPIDVHTAWDRISAAPSRGWSVEMLPGTYTSMPYLSFPGYVSGTIWNASGPTATRPIIFRALDGKGTVTINEATFDTAGVNYLYLINLTIRASGGDTVHFTYGHHLLLRNMTLIGDRVSAEETLKVNQAKYVYVESSDISGGYNNALDFVAVQYGRIVGNKLHNADDWCAYVKGGSAYLVVEGNEIYDCGTGGFSAGQGTGFEYMVSPWLQYETYDVKVFNNIIHNTAGAGLGVNGGYNILLAYNTLYHVGGNSHAIEVVYGSRSCDGLTSVCSANLRAGGWGTTSLIDSANIPDRNIFIYNNIVYNPTGYQSQWQHFQFANPIASLSGSNIPSPVTTDNNLKIRGNLIWNGPADLPLGIEDSQVCQSTNTACNSVQLHRDNSFNLVEPQLVDPAHGDFRPVANGSVIRAVTYALPSFTWNVSAPRGTLANSVTQDYFGNTRNSSARIVGAVAVNGTAPIACALSCTSPQLLNSTSCSCYTPVVTSCTNTCAAGFTRGAYPGCACTCSLSCTSPQLLNSTSCSCYNPVVTPPTNTTNGTNTTTTPPVSGSFSLPVSTKCAATALRTIDVNSEATIINAINTAVPGDVIRIAPGTYTFGNQLWIEAHGTAANPICIVARDNRGSVRITVPSDEGFNVGGNSSYLVFEDLELSNMGNNVFHVQDGSHHITLRNLNLHDAGFDGDVVKINQANNILIEGCDIARPGPRPSTNENPYQEGIDLVDSAGSIVRYNFIHDFGNIGAYAKGSSRGILFENNVLDNQRSSAIDPALGIGGWTDTYLFNGSQYEIYDMTARHNLVSHVSYVALGLYDAYNSTIVDNRFLNNNGVAVIQSRAGNAPLATTNLVRITNNQFIATTGSLPPAIYQLHSHSISGVSANGNLYWNNGASIPTGSDFGFVPASETGAVVQNPQLSDVVPTTYLQAMALLNWSGSVIVTPPINTSGNSTNNTNGTISCTLSCNLPALLNDTSCSCYTPVVTPPTNTTNTTTTPPSSGGSVRIYVSGESIERRNRFVATPFTSGGTLNGAANSNDEYGWMVPLMDKLKLRSSGLNVQFVGSDVWSGAEDFAYSGTYPSSTPLNTSAISGMSTDDWITNRQAEITSKRFCYNVALIDRGGNDGWMGVTERKDFIKQVALLVSDGSSCNSNPAVYVIAHMPDQFSTNQAPAYQGAPRDAVTELNSQYPSKNIRFIDVYGAFYNNAPTTAFPSPTWRSGSGFNFGSILLSGDIGHPARLSSIYFGEVVANAINLAELGANSSGGSITPPTPPACTLSCTSPQLLNSTSCSCYTPVVSPPVCSLSCTSPQLLNSTSCSCYSPVVSPPTNTTNTTTNTSGGNLTYSSAPIIPTINSAMKSHLRSVYLAGQSSGKRSDVFAKVGDSITESGSYLVDFGCPGGTDNMGSYSSLLSTVQYFSSRSLGSAPVWCELGNSFTRASMVATMGWTSGSALSSTTACASPNNSYLKCELATIQPSYAFIMYGTNDLDQVNDLTIYRTNLNRIIDDAEAAGVIPVLSTIPPRLDSTTYNSRVAQYNAVVVDVAQNRNIPLWNYWKTSTLTGMVHQGLDADGIHPNVLGGQYGTTLTTSGLTYGYNQRNLQTLQILEKLKRIVADNGAPDS